MESCEKDIKEFVFQSMHISTLFTTNNIDIKTILVRHYMHIRIVLTLMSIMPCLVVTFFFFFCLQQ